MDAALAIVTGEGLEAVTMQRLAAELGYAVGALYRYFPSKDALLIAVQQRVLEQLAADVEEARARLTDHLARSRTVSAEAGALAHVVVAARVYETWSVRRPAHFALLGRWLAEPAPLVETEAARSQAPVLLALFAPVPRAFDEAVAVGALAPGDAVRRTAVLWSALAGVLQLRKLDRLELPALRSDALARELVRALLSGWGAPDPHLSEALKRAANVVSQGTIGESS